jgi:archaemetzincin
MLFALCLSACAERAPAAGDGDAEALKRAAETLRPLHSRLGKPKPGDWLDRHREPGQTFAQYLRCSPVTPRGARRVIYIQPLGDFNRTQRKIVRKTADFMALYFNRPVKVLKELPLSVIPARARRAHPTWGDKQVLTTYVLDNVLKPKLPKDAASLIAFTTSDLWPGKGWNFVFGQASLRERVGVWSIYRNGDPEKDDAGFRLCLLRTMKTATHELGHMFSMQHCTAYECNLCGSNHRKESDRRPIALCPECLPKVCWATQAAPAPRFRKLADFCADAGLEDEAFFYRKSANALEGWATPLRAAGLPNLNCVTPALYRGAQPTAEGMRRLKKMGVRTVVNLRSFHSDRDEIGETGLAYEHIYMKAWNAEDEEVVRFLQIVSDPKRAPVFVHCQHGADRTGVMCAIYRVALCNWSKEKAMAEMTEGGFGHHSVWVNLRRYLRALDIDAMKKRAGVK